MDDKDEAYHILPFFIPPNVKENISSFLKNDETLMRSQILVKQPVDTTLQFYEDGKLIEAPFFYWRPKIDEKHETSFEKAIKLTKNKK